MSAGTIALTNNSANVTGTGTAFTTDLKANDFIVAIVGGVTYTLAVKATTSATALTLITPYGGPTATGNAWTAVPNATLVGITAQVAADVAKAIRGLNLDKANWQGFYTATGDTTINLPDGTSVTGPSWPSMKTTLAKAYNDGGLLSATVTPNSLGNAADFNIYYQTANANALIANGYPIAKAGTLFVTKSAYGCQQMYITFQGEAYVRGLTGTFTPAAPNWSDWWPILTGKSIIPVASGGTGATTAAAARTALGAAPLAAPVFTGGATVNGVLAVEGSGINLRSTTPAGGWPTFITFMAGQGNNLPYSRIYGENSGDITVSTGVAATIKYFAFNAAGDFSAPRNISCVALTQTSDRDKKDFITPITNALDKINAIDGVSFVWKADGTPSAGVIAQDLVKVLPEAVGSIFEDKDEYGTEEQQVEKEVVAEDGTTSTVTETVSVTRLIRKRDDSKRSYTVEYNAVIALAVQAIKELSEKVSELEAMIDPDKPAAMSKEEPAS